MDWVGAEPPTDDALAGGKVVLQAKTDFRAIANTGGAVLGLRPLELDQLMAVVPGYAVGAVHRVWGWETIVNRAQELLVPSSAAFG
jgi:hypothetical protein